MRPSSGMRTPSGPAAWRLANVRASSTREKSSPPRDLRSVREPTQPPRVGSAPRKGWPDRSRHSRRARTSRRLRGMSRVPLSAATARRSSLESMSWMADSGQARRKEAAVHERLKGAETSRSQGVAPSAYLDRTPESHGSIDQVATRCSSLGALDSPGPPARWRLLQRLESRVLDDSAPSIAFSDELRS
jgi:hypothetical protein